MHQHKGISKKKWCSLDTLVFAYISKLQTGPMRSNFSKPSELCLHIFKQFCLEGLLNTHQSSVNGFLHIEDNAYVQRVHIC